MRGGYHMYLFYVKVKLITKQTYYVSGVRLYNKGKILVVHYVIWLLPCKGVGGIWVRWKGHMNTITNYRADSSFQQSCSAGPSNASRACRKLESTPTYPRTHTTCLLWHAGRKSHPPIKRSLRIVSAPKIWKWVKNRVSMTAQTNSLLGKIPKTSTQDC